MTPSVDPPGASRRLAIIAPDAASVLRNRAGLIAAAKSRGHAVLVLAPTHLASEAAALHALGAEHQNFELTPPGVALLARWRLLRGLAEKLSAWRPHTALVSARGLAAVAAAAARKARVKRIVTLVSDLGTGDGRAAQAEGYRDAVRLSGAVICNNTDDLALMERQAGRSNKAEWVAVTGCGSETGRITAQPLPEPASPSVFLFIADPANRDAINAYAAAARAVAQSGSQARFRLAADREATGDPSILTVAGVEFLGKAGNPVELIGAAHVYVHLSNDDGMPVALLEALAVGRPILTLDAPGCRSAVDDRVNGCLVPPGDADELVRGLKSFIDAPGLLDAEGRASRAKAERSFAAPAVLATLMKVLHL